MTNNVRLARSIISSVSNKMNWYSYKIEKKILFGWKILSFILTLLFFSKTNNTCHWPFFMNSPLYASIRPQQTGTRLRPSNIHSFMETNQCQQVRYKALHFCFNGHFFTFNTKKTYLTSSISGTWSCFLVFLVFILHFRSPLWSSCLWYARVDTIKNGPPTNDSNSPPRQHAPVVRLKPKFHAGIADVAEATQPSHGSATDKAVFSEPQSWYDNGWGTGHVLGGHAFDEPVTRWVWRGDQWDHHEIQ